MMDVLSHAEAPKDLASATAQTLLKAAVLAPAEDGYFGVLRGRYGVV